MTATPLFRLHHVTKHYGSRQVLDIGCLEIERGEMLALVGPSGAGKSTLLRLLNLLEAPTSGTIAFEGQPIHADRVALALRRRITTVFQRAVLLSGSVLDNVAYGLRLRRAADARPRASAALEQVGLTHLAQQNARTLSGGEIQRVALARALVLEPDVLLLDEPTANLDPHNVQLIERTITALHQRGTTIVLATHHLFQARRLAQRAALLLEGSIVEIAPTHTFFTAPRDPRTAAFVHGDMIY